MSGPLKLCVVGNALTITGLVAMYWLGAWALLFSAVGVGCAAGAVVWSLVGGMKAARALFDHDIADPDEDKEWWEADDQRR